MKYNTISEYMGGGYMRPQMYQEGGMSRRAKNILGSAFIGKGVMDAQKSLTEESRQAGKEAGRRSLFGTVGGFLVNRNDFIISIILGSSADNLLTDARDCLVCCLS